MKKYNLKDLNSFLQDELWRVNSDEVSKPRRILYYLLKVIISSINEYNKGRVINKAAALTYSTLISIIPILAILFAIAKGFGFSSIIETELRTNLHGNSEAAETIITLVDSYLTHARSGIFIGAGLIILLWSILSLTNNMERTFNSIWQVQKPRTVYRKITDYFSMIVLLPIFTVVSSGITIFMTTTLKTIENYELLAPILQIIIRFTPFTISSIMFTALYVFIPNTNVKLKYSIIPGIIAGIAFQSFQYLYVGSQIWVANYNAIYGSFAAIPMFILWTQISWSICLFGAELCYVTQNIKSYYYNKETYKISRRYHDFLCILIMSLICKKYETSLPPYTAEAISDEYKIPIRLVKSIIYELLNINMLKETPDKNDPETMAYVPAMDINQLNVGNLLNEIYTNGAETFKINPKQYSSTWNMITQARYQYYEETKKILLKDL